MPIPTLTWNKSTEQSVPCAGASVTYAEMLNKMKGLIDASTHWNSTINLDAVNNRGYLELRPKSLVANITEGRFLYCVANNAYAGATGTERPLQVNRQSPWAVTTTGLTCKQWLAFSPNANTTGPDNDPWGGVAGVYTGGGKVWSKLCVLNQLSLPPGQVMGIIESAEAICVYWTQQANHVVFFIFGKIVESPDGNSADWGMMASLTPTDGNPAVSTAWSGVPSAVDASPLGTSVGQNFVGAASRAWGILQKVDGTIIGFGRTQFDTISNVGRGFSNTSDALLQAIVVAGGIYAGGSNDSLVGILRQLRWGPPALRGQRLIDGSGATQGFYLSYTAATTQPMGLWFHNAR